MFLFTFFHSKYFKIKNFIKMEAKLENIVDSLMQNENVVGALVADSQGFSYACKLMEKIIKIIFN